MVDAEVVDPLDLATVRPSMPSAPLFLLSPPKSGYGSNELSLIPPTSVDYKMAGRGEAGRLDYEDSQWTT